MTGFVVQGHILTLILWELIILIIEKHQNVFLDHHIYIIPKGSNIRYRIQKLKNMFNASTAKKKKPKKRYIFFKLQWFIDRVISLPISCFKKKATSMKLLKLIPIVPVCSTSSAAPALLKVQVHTGISGSMKSL